MFDNLGAKHKREVEQRRKDAKRKLEAQKRDDEMRSAMEAEQRSREVERLRLEEEARLRNEEEKRLNDGVRFVAHLQPRPLARADDKLHLPPSALEELMQQGAIEKGTLLTFSISVPQARGDEVSTLVVGTTHAGVAEFTAEEGTVGVPPRVALCLTRGAGLDTLGAARQVEVRYVRLPRSAKSVVRFQPRGEGFHAGGIQNRRIDLEHTLQESLRGHTALTEGDWLPIRHEGYTFELIVRELGPESKLALLDTDLTVEVLPSEQTEAELQAEEQRKAREEAAAREAEERERLRLEHARRQALRLDAEPVAGPEAVQLRLRIPSGANLMRRFARTVKFEQVMIWVESEPDTNVQPDNFRIVQKWPGHARELGPAEANQTLHELGFARQEALFLQHLAEQPGAAADEQDDAAQSGEPATAAASGSRAAPPQLPAGAADAGAWAAAEEQAHQDLDRRLERVESPTNALKEQSLDSLHGQELVGIFERLVALGMPPPDAAVASKKYPAQLKELGEMGFENWVDAVPLLDKYNGRLVRVINLLSEGMATSELNVPMATPAAPPPAAAPTTQPAAEAAAPAAAPQRSQGPANLPKEVVQAKFKELVAAGVTPNEAATRAIKEVRAALAAGAGPAVAAQPAAASPEAPPAQAAPVVLDEEEKLRELANMGFVDEQQNRAMLKKYAGRMERVVDALCNA